MKMKPSSIQLVVSALGCALTLAFARTQPSQAAQSHAPDKLQKSVLARSLRQASGRMTSCSLVRSDSGAYLDLCVERQPGPLVLDATPQAFTSLAIMPDFPLCGALDFVEAPGGDLIVTVAFNGGASTCLVLWRVRPLVAGLAGGSLEVV